MRRHQDYIIALPFRTTFPQLFVNESFNPEESAPWI